MFEYYLISTGLCLLVMFITLLSVNAKFKREYPNRKRKSSSIFEVLRSVLPLFIPIFNIIITLVMLLKYDEIYKRTVA